MTHYPRTIQETTEVKRRTLLAACVAGEKQAWRTLHREYYPVAFAFLRKLGVDSQHLEDVCQEVFLQVFRYLPRFRGEADIKTWMYRICISEARRYRHKEKASRVLTALLGREPSSAPSSGLALDESSAAQRVLDSLSKLPARRRTMLILFDLEGLSGHQVAEIMDCSVTSVWRELHHARVTFMEAFEQTKGTQ